MMIHPLPSDGSTIDTNTIAADIRAANLAPSRPPVVERLHDLIRQRSHVDADDNPILASRLDLRIALLKEADRLREIVEAAGA
jgi:hypothetical protein